MLKISLTVLLNDFNHKKRLIPAAITATGINLFYMPYFIFTRSSFSPNGFAVKQRKTKFDTEYIMVWGIAVTSAEK